MGIASVPYIAPQGPSAASTRMPMVTRCVAWSPSMVPSLGASSNWAWAGAARTIAIRQNKTTRIAILAPGRQDGDSGQTTAAARSLGGNTLL